ncbi:penicillin-binding protein activator [Desulfovibrio inopinatus]|uniref:penicillin-binding protein activator n=1 Tax=Desulfovibrio inopinatus TaxID=102109 RepID=UPI0004250299|nr:penicillin-binding protein activator [Desulfovibrio inopinatus]
MRWVGRRENITVFRGVVAICAVLLLFGCTMMVPKPGTSSKATGPSPASQLNEEASRAWNNGDYAQSEILYSKLVSMAGLSASQRNQGFERMVKSAYFLERYEAVLKGLDRWKNFNPDIWRQPVWLLLHAKSLEAMGRGQSFEAESYLSEVLTRNDVPADTAAIAAVELFSLFAKGKNPAGAVTVVRDAYTRMPTTEDKVRMEAWLARTLDGLDSSAFSSLETMVNEQSRFEFPQALIAFEQARRLARDYPEKRGELRQYAQLLASQGNIADRTLFIKILDGGVANLPFYGLEKPKAMAGAKKHGALKTAVILPLGGAFRELGGKVQAGVAAAEKVLQQNGTPVQVTIIDSTAPDFNQTLASLDPTIHVVGGPMHKQTFGDLVKAGALSGRVPLCFLPSLADVTEGSQAWRFFGSPEDEVAALAELAVKDYRLTRLAVLRPSDRYGTTMADLFVKAVRSRGGEVVMTGSYDPNNPASWRSVVENMVGENGQTNYDAVFVPDAWDRIDGIVPYFFYFNANHLLFLGPRLWSQALTRAAVAKRPIDVNHYRLAVFPGAYNPQSNTMESAALKSAYMEQTGGEPDFWVALGYDYLRFAVALGDIDPMSPRDRINARLAETASHFQWTMAPLQYDTSGLASQQMFLFRPSVEGMKEINKDGFYRRLETIRGQGAFPAGNLDMSTRQSAPEYSGGGNGVSVVASPPASGAMEHGAAPPVSTSLPATSSTPAMVNEPPAVNEPPTMSTGSQGTDGY